MHSSRGMKRIGIVAALTVWLAVFGLTVALVPVPAGAEEAVPNPPPFSRTLALPDLTACICTPRLMLSSQSGVTDWFAKAAATRMTVTLITQSVNPAEQGSIGVEIFDAVTGESVPLTPSPWVQPIPTTSTDITDFRKITTVAGRVYRVRLTLIPPESGPVAHHYQLQLHGAVQIGQNSPTAPSFEPVGEPATTFWFVSVDADERPQVRIFTPAPGILGAPWSDQTITATVKLRKPDGTLVQDLSLEAQGGLSATLAASGPGTEGLWIVEIKNINAHYQVEKLTGTDQGIYATWVTAGRGLAPTVVLHTFPAINFVGGDAFLGRKGVDQTHSATATVPNAGDLTFQWSFGQSATYPNNAQVSPFSVTDQATVPFATPGVHLVRVTVTDHGGASATASLRKVVVDSFACTRGSGFWNQQFGYGDRKRGGGKKIDDVTLQAYLDVLHITSRLFSGITLEQAQAILGTQADSSMRTKAEAQALAAWLNFARGAIALDERFWVEMTAADGSRRPRMVFAEAMIKVEAILSNPNATKNELARAKDIAEAANQSDSDDPVCMADPDRREIGPAVTGFVSFFSCPLGARIYLRPRTGSGTTYVVDDDGGADFKRIDRAVKASSDGDVIYVCAGTYDGDFEVPTAISLISFAGADDTIIKGDPANTIEYVVGLTADVLLQGFTIHGGGAIVCALGGGVLVTNDASSVIRQNMIFDNENCIGAGITLFDSGTTVVENNIIAFNTSTVNGAGGIHELGAAGAKIVNNVIAYNVAGPDSTINPAGGGIGGSGTLDIRNNILYCNTSGTDYSGTGYNVIAVSSSATVEYNNSFGNTDTNGDSRDYTGGTGNINADPLFSGAPSSGACTHIVSPASPSAWGLQSSSPSIDAGDPDSAYNDVDGTTNDQGAYGGPEGDW